MAKRTPLPTIYCHRCKCAHPEGEHSGQRRFIPVATKPKPEAKPRPAKGASAGTPVPAKSATPGRTAAAGATAGTSDISEETAEEKLARLRKQHAERMARYRAGLKKRNGK